MTGAELQVWRNRHELTRPEAAQLLFCTPHHLYILEQRATIPSYMDMLCWLADFPKVKEGMLQRIGFIPRKRGRKPRAIGGGDVRKICTIECERV